MLTPLKTFVAVLLCGTVLAAAPPPSVITTTKTKTRTHTVTAPHSISTVTKTTIRTRTASVSATTVTVTESATTVTVTESATTVTATAADATLINIGMGLDPFELYAGYNLKSFNSVYGLEYAHSGYSYTQFNFSGGYNAHLGYALYSYPISPNTNYNFSLFANTQNPAGCDCTLSVNADSSGDLVDGAPTPVNLDAQFYGEINALFTTGATDSTVDINVDFTCDYTPHDYYINTDDWVLQSYD